MSATTARYEKKLNDALKEIGKEGETFDNHNALKGNSIGSRANKIHRLAMVKRETNKPLTKLSQKELDNILLKRQKELNPDSFKVTCLNLREFYEVHKKKLKVEIPEGGKKELPDILTLEEIKKLTDGITNLRDRTVVKLLYETGARANEIATLKLKHVNFDDVGGTVTIQTSKTKTGARQIRIINSIPDLKVFINQHPNRDDGNADLFYRHKRGKYDSITADAIHGITTKWTFKILGKSVSPHIFRHSRATHLVAAGVPPRHLKRMFGWRSSKMLEIYEHLTMDDTDAEFAKAHGLPPKKDTQLKIETITCKKCKTRNNITSRFCQECGADMITDRLMQSKTVRQYGEQIQELREQNKVLMGNLERERKRISEVEKKMEDALINEGMLLAEREEEVQYLRKKHKDERRPRKK
ncbi:MAG: tyrosine-type recombinase/integrase [Candidatus Bathyarchaeia archaeon]